MVPLPHAMKGGTEKGLTESIDGGYFGELSVGQILHTKSRRQEHKVRTPLRASTAP